MWVIRTKVQVHCLSGHEDTVAAILAMPTDPQVRTPAAGLPVPACVDVITLANPVLQRLSLCP